MNEKNENLSDEMLKDISGGVDTEGSHHNDQHISIENPHLHCPIKKRVHETDSEPTKHEWL